jgi:hypothetical protein
MLAPNRHRAAVIRLPTAAKTAFCRPYPVPAVERSWHIEDSQDQIPVLASRLQTALRTVFASEGHENNEIMATVEMHHHR